MNFSDYVVYADESGDHSLTKINPDHPVFVLAFCIFEKKAFTGSVVPAMQQLKFDFWGHDGVILHSHEIRKSHGDFNILLNAATRGAFVDRVSALIETQPFTIIAAAIDKQRHAKQYANPANPYEIALTFCMERLQHWLRGQGQADRLTHVMVERRGKAEDDALELQFRRIAAGQNAVGAMRNLDIRFMDKKHNSTGLQFADLVAHPIGRHVVKPEQENRAFARLEPKFRKSPQGRISGYGLKVFP